MKIRIAILAVCASALFLTQSYVAQAKDDGIVINLPWAKGDKYKTKKTNDSTKQSISGANRMGGGGGGKGARDR